MVRVQGKEPKRQAGEEWRCVRWLRSLTLGCSRPFAEWGSEAHARVSCKIQRASGTRGQDPSLHLVSKGERQTRGKRELLFSRFLFLLCLEKNEVPRADSGPVPLEQLEQPLSLVFLGRHPSPLSCHLAVPGGLTGAPCCYLFRTACLESPAPFPLTGCPKPSKFPGAQPNRALRAAVILVALPENI